jgi:endonuclease III
MRNDSEQARNLKQLLEHLDADQPPEDPPACEPVTQLVIGLLQWEATRKQAESAFAKLMEHLVDINELRVSHDRELVSIIGQNYPRAEERIARLQEVLNEIFVREHGVAMSSIASKSKKEQRAYLDSLPGLPPYVAAQVMLLAYGGHALPVDEKLVSLLAQQEILEPETSPAQAESTLLRQIKASEAVHAHALFQSWADSSKAPRRSRRQSGSKTAKKKAASKSSNGTQSKQK